MTLDVQSNGVQSGAKYQRMMSRSAKIRLFLDRDPMLALVAMTYLGRFAGAKNTLWWEGSEPWIAQPIRCSATEMGLSDRGMKDVHKKLEHLRAFEFKAIKLYPKAVRKTTCLRPTKMFWLFLLKIGWCKYTDWHLTNYTPEDEQACAALCKARGVTWEDSFPDTKEDSFLLMESKEGETNVTSGKKIPTSSQCNQLQKEQTVVLPSKPKMEKKPVKTMIAAAQEVLAKPMASPKGVKAKAWRDMALEVKKAGVTSFPMSAPPVDLARFYKLVTDLKGDFSINEQEIYAGFALVASKWHDFGMWMLDQWEKKIPPNFDPLWCQARRHKFWNYVTAPIHAPVEDPFSKKS